MSLSSVSIYNYENPSQFLLDRVGDLQRNDAGLSIRLLAKRMGFKSHSLLLMLLQGKRPLRVKHAQFLARGLGLNSTEQLYLQALIQYESARDMEEKQLCQHWLSEINPRPLPSARVLQEFECVSNWIHMAILALSDLPGFAENAQAIARRFRNAVKPAEVRAAIERLKSLGLLQYNKDGLLQATDARLTTQDDVANQGARKYHGQVVELSKAALENTPLEQREFQSFTIAMDSARIPEAKEMIRKFRIQFAREMGKGVANEVFQCNLQFFQLTESPILPSKIEDEGVDSPTQELGMTQ